MTNSASTSTRHPRPTQSSIPLGSVNEYQVWFIPLVDVCGVCT